MNKTRRALIIFLAVIFIFAAQIARADSERAIADGSLQLQFPRDHGSHPNFGTEWWYYTGHLTTEESQKFGFELTFFRILVDPTATQSRSLWASQSLYLAHFTITDDSAQKFHAHDAISRESFKAAGAENTMLNVHLGSWFARMNSDSSIDLAADADGDAISLHLQSEKPEILEGENGFSKKGPNVGDASYYSSLSRLTCGGERSAGNRGQTPEGVCPHNQTLTVNNKTFKIVNSLVWMDHEFMSSHQNATATGWDWFAIQLHDGTEVMLYELHTKEQIKGAFSSGSFINHDGSKITLNRDDFEVAPLDTWQSPKTGITYPSGWRIKIPSRNVDLTIRPTVKNQELITTETTGITYWEGRSSVHDSAHENAEVGDAYVELVGYK